MRAQYPETMTIVLQYQFWDLAVTDEAFEVGLSFGGVTERLAVPFDAVTAFFDPAVQFGFQFEPIDGEGRPKIARSACGGEGNAGGRGDRKAGSLPSPPLPLPCKAGGAGSAPDTAAAARS